MKTTAFTVSLLLSAAILGAQTEKKTTATVHIKKTENINGVEKITDTTYTSSDPSVITLDHGHAMVEAWPDGKQQKVIIINDDMDSQDLNIENKDGNVSVTSDTKGHKVERTIIMNGPGDKTDENTMAIHVGEAMTPEEEKAWEEKMSKLHEHLGNTPSIVLKDADTGKPVKTEETTIIVKKGPHCGATAEEMKGEPAYIVHIMRKVNISDVSSDDLAHLGKPAGNIDNKLAVDKVDFYPNPNNGKFNTKFSLKEKGNAAVSIMNGEGKIIYSEQLKDFSGTYDKEIDISQHPKGIYFMKIEQGKHAQLKKIVLE